MIFDSRKSIIQALVDGYKWYLAHTTDARIAQELFLQQLKMSPGKWERCLVNSPDLKLAFDSI